MPSDRPVEARGLVKRYGAITAVDNVDLTVEPGDVYGFLGPNGAGKTTTLRILLGLIRPDDGEARLFGRDPQHELPRRRSRRLRRDAVPLLVPQRPEEPRAAGRVRSRRRQRGS